MIWLFFAFVNNPWTSACDFPVTDFFGAWVRVDLYLGLARHLLNSSCSFCFSSRRPEFQAGGGVRACAFLKVGQLAACISCLTLECSCIKRLRSLAAAGDNYGSGPFDGGWRLCSRGSLKQSPAACVTATFVQGPRTNKRFAFAVMPKGTSNRRRVISER